MSQKPTVGRIVHFYPPPLSGGGEEILPPQPWAALVTFVSMVESTDGVPLVNLAVFDGFAEQRALLGVEFSPEPKPGCWTWPPRTT